MEDACTRVDGITVCDHATELCPVFPGDTRHIHWSFEDPAAVEGADDNRISAFRKVRDEIRDRLAIFVEEHNSFRVATSA